MSSEEQLNFTISKILEESYPCSLDLTTRLLREKAEDELKLERAALKDKRDYIKTIILAWWKEKNTVNGGDEQQTIFKQFSKLLGVVGLGSTFIKSLNNLTISDKIAAAKHKLKSIGIEFSDTPNDEEIKKIKKSRDIKKELEDIAESIILPSGQKRRNDTSSIYIKEKCSKIEYNSSDEEEEF